MDDDSCSLSDEFEPSTKILSLPFPFLRDKLSIPLTGRLPRKITDNYSLVAALKNLVVYR